MKQSNPKTRFDLEQEIMSCWSVVDDIDLVCEKIYDSSQFEGINVEQAEHLTKMLIGMRTLYDAKFDRAFKTFEELVRKEELS